jgi:hypothetical protein
MVGGCTKLHRRVRFRESVTDAADGRGVPNASLENELSLFT